MTSSVPSAHHVTPLALARRSPQTPGRGRGLWAIGWLALAGVGVRSAEPALRPADVVFMYQADRATYQAYGATVLAWGGTPDVQSKTAAAGVRFFGSVGMVTEFAAYHRRFPTNYQDGLCRDLAGQPVKVPWLTDHQSHGVPYWWCCTQQPLFRTFLRERVEQTIRAGADGLHVDDHLGTAGGLWLGICFCDRCVAGFRDYLASVPAEDRAPLGAIALESLDFRDAVRQWIAADPTRRKPTGHPAWPLWTAYQCRAAAAFMQELRQLAAKTAGRPVPVGANAGLLWPRHLCDYQAVDLFSAETDHHAAERRFPDLPILAYRMAEAVGRPYAATASGGDWAFIKEQNKPGLVRGWIALAYAAGQQLMVPHRQWCYTPEKGTHWYEGPRESFAPLYQFVRTHAARFDGYTTHAEVAVVLPHRSFVKNPGRWFEVATRLAGANIAYRVLLAGDELVDHPLTAADLAGAGSLLVLDRADLLPSDAQRLSAAKATVFTTVEEALAALRPAVSVESRAAVRCLPRTKAGSAVIHLLNYDYDFAADRTRPQESVRVRVNPGALGLASVRQCEWLQPEGAPEPLEYRDGGIMVPRLGLWSLVVMEGAPNAVENQR